MEYDMYGMGSSWLMIVGGAITTFIGAFASWFFTKKKYNSEVKATEIENMQKSLDFYHKLSDDTNQRLEKIQSKNDSLEAQVASLKVENSELKAMVASQSVKIDNLQKEITKLLETLKATKNTKK